MGTVWLVTGLFPSLNVLLCCQHAHCDCEHNHTPSYTCHLHANLYERVKSKQNKKETTVKKGVTNEYSCPYYDRVSPGGGGLRFIYSSQS